MEELYLGVDIGGTKCAVVIGTKSQNIMERIEFPTAFDKTPKEQIEKVIRMCKKLSKKYSLVGTAKGVGISCGGPLDDRKGIILSPPNLPGWDEIPIVAWMEESLDLPVSIQNDANACAIAEWKYGAGKGSQNMVFLTFGTGLGAGLILNGRLYSGTNGMAGEVGHIRLTGNGPTGYGKAGSFEGYCSGGGIKELCAVETKKKYGEDRDYVILNGECYLLHEITAKIIFEYADQGDSFALRIVEICAEQLGKGLSILIDTLNPEIIVLGSIFVRGEHLLREKMQKWIREEALERANEVCEIKGAELGERIGDIAALTVAVYNAETKVYAANFSRRA